MTVPNPVSGRFHAVRFHDMLDQQEAVFLLETELALAFVDGRFHRFYTHKLADSAEPRTEWLCSPLG